MTESNSKYFDKKTAGGALFPPGPHTRSDETFEELFIDQMITPLDANEKINDDARLTC